MNDPLFSSSWYRVAELRPRVRAHTRVHHHRYRGRPWIVLENFSSGRFLRFTPETHHVVEMLDGERTMNEVWERAAEQLGEHAPSQDDLIRLLAQLHAADLLQSSQVSPDVRELFERFERATRGKRIGRFLNPLAIQIPLFDPERFLERTIRWVRPFLGRMGGLAWLAIVGSALFIVGARFEELTEGLLDRALAVENLILIALAFPLVKAAHELGHAYATKHFGGEVHDMGILFLVGMPVPYVDASSASAFPERSRRMLVGAAGMAIEILIASLAIWLWSAMEPGPLRAVAFNVVLIAGVTTLVFNANPLLRFDGYYILADWLEIPNLRQRANAHLTSLFERRLLGLRDARPLVTDRAERAWLVGYSVAAFCYRLIVIVSIAWLLLDTSLVLGTLVLMLVSITWIGMPTWKGLRFLLSNPRLGRRRPRAIAFATGLVLAMTISFFALPLPLRSTAEGVVWVPEESRIRAGTGGFVAEVLAAPGDRVAADQPLFRLEDPEIDTRTQVLSARIDELSARRASIRGDDPAAARVLEEELGYAHEQLARDRKRQADLSVRSPLTGTFVAPRIDRLPGRYVSQGQHLADVVDLQSTTVRAVIRQHDVELVRNRFGGAQARLAEDPDRVLPAVLKRMVPAASDRLPSPALAIEGGGQIATDPRLQDRPAALERFFEIELELPDAGGLVNAGGRVHLRFDHGSEPLAKQMWRRVRQLFLARLDV